MCSALPHASPALGRSLLCGWLQLGPSASLEYLRAGLGGQAWDLLLLQGPEGICML